MGLFDRLQAKKAAKRQAEMSQMSRDNERALQNAIRRYVSGELSHEGIMAWFVTMGISRKRGQEMLDEAVK